MAKAVVDIQDYGNDGRGWHWRLQQMRKEVIETRGDGDSRVKESLDSQMRDYGDDSGRGQHQRCGLAMTVEVDM